MSFVSSKCLKNSSYINALIIRFTVVKRNIIQPLNTRLDKFTETDHQSQS